MLNRLIIKNYKLIDQLELKLPAGLTILTGETGAGKSILLDAIKLVLGDRGSALLIKDKTKPLIVEAYFTINNNLLDEIFKIYDLEPIKNDLHIYRKIDEDGKNSVRINGEPVNVKILKELGENLIDLCSQHQHQTLFSKANHKTILDSFGGEEVTSIKDQFRKHRTDYVELKTKYDKLVNDSVSIEKEKGFLEFQIVEIEEAKLQQDEEEQLLNSQKRLENMTRLADESEASLKYLTEADEYLRKANTSLNNLSRIDEEINPTKETVASAVYSMEDAIRDLSAYRDKLEFSPDALSEINARLFIISSLKRKYGPRYDDIFTTLSKLKTDLEKITSPDNDLNAIELKLKSLGDMLTLQGIKLSELRTKTAKNIEILIARELSDLMLPHATLNISINQIADQNGLLINNQKTKLFTDGIDDVEFLFSANPGIKPAELKNIASGGELSRVMLALKSIFFKSASTPTIIFDEIDTGVSGNTAIKIAGKLNELAAKYQVICVTHLANIAAQGNSHLFINKEVINDQTYISTDFISGTTRENEIARLLGGTQSKITIEHARELLGKTR